MNYTRLNDQLSSDEGKRSHVYKCTSGKNTIGKGRNIDDNPITLDEWNFILSMSNFTASNTFLVESLLAGNIGINDVAIEYLFKNDIERCERSIRKYFDWFENLPDIKQETLINLCFQIGFDSLCGFKKMLFHLSNNDFENAGVEFKDSKYWRERIEKKYKDRAERHLKNLTGG